MSVTTAAKTVEKLQTIFAAFGLPEEVVTDNGLQFVSLEFAASLSSNRIHHKTTPPYHPVSERLVQTVKRNLEKQLKDEERVGVFKSIQHCVDQFLFYYRNIPCAATGKAPTKLFLPWSPRTRLTMLPKLHNLLEKDERQHAQQPAAHWHELKEGDKVRVKGTRPGEPA